MRSKAAAILVAPHSSSFFLSFFSFRHKLFKFVIVITHEHDIFRSFSHPNPTVDSIWMHNHSESSLNPTALFRDIERSIRKRERKNRIAFYLFQCSRLEAHIVRIENADENENKNRVNKIESMLCSHEGNYPLKHALPDRTDAHTITHHIYRRTWNRIEIYILTCGQLSSPCILSASILHALFCVQNIWLSLSRMAWK